MRTIAWGEISPDEDLITADEVCAYIVAADHITAYSIAAHVLIDPADINAAALTRGN